MGLCISTDSNIYLAENTDYKIRKIDNISKVIATYAGTGGNAATLTSGVQATSVTIAIPDGVWGDTKGKIYFSGGITSKKIRMIGSSGILTTIIATGSASPTTTGVNGDSGRAISATLSYPYHIIGDTDGNVYFVDLSQH